MHAVPFSLLCSGAGYEPYRQHDDPLVKYLLTDSRKLLHPESTIFFAISSDHKDANQFIPRLYDEGVRCFVFSGEMKQDLPEANLLMVDDVLAALQRIVAAHRSRFDIPVVGITGSNGKTIVKEWLYQLLHTRYNIVRSPKSFNSQVGVPLSVWNLNHTHDMGLFEAGISSAREMQPLEEIIRPTIGVLTFIGEAHAAGFSSREEKISEKLLLFRRSNILVYNSDDAEVEGAVLKFRELVNPALHLVSWGNSESNSLKVNEISRQPNLTTVTCSWKLEPLILQIPFTDIASVNNVLTCAALALHLGESNEGIIQKVAQLRPVQMRLEMKDGINHCSIINDSYSSDLNSLFIALDFLQQQKQHPIKTIILSDILQSGLPPEELYSAVADALIKRKINRFIGIGPELTTFQEFFQRIPERTFFFGTEAFLYSFSTLNFREETILLKGARVFHFERISSLLEQKRHETVLEINLNAIRNNLGVYRSLLKPGVKLMAMVKAAGYGSGSSEIGSVMEHSGADYLTVAYTDEGVELRQKGSRLPIMIMNTEEAAFDTLLAYNLEPEIYSFKLLNSFISFLEEREAEEFPIHIKLDTGMHRLGFTENELEELVRLLRYNNRVKVQSVFSHLAGSDDPVHDDFTSRQSEMFLRSTKTIASGLGYDFLKHLSNTSAIFRHPQLQLNMVRLGIGLYGYDSNSEVQKRLKTVASLKTSVSQIKEIAAGESVGYSRKGIVTRDSRIATVRIGYADGYPRILSNGKGHMLVNGRLAPVIGNICMDMTMLDVTDIEVTEGDEVIVFNEDLKVSEVAEWASTIPYEILTGISERVKRVYYEE